MNVIPSYFSLFLTIPIIWFSLLTASCSKESPLDSPYSPQEVAYIKMTSTLNLMNKDFLATLTILKDIHQFAMDLRLFKHQYPNFTEKKKQEAREVNKIVALKFLSYLNLANPLCFAHWQYEETFLNEMPFKGWFYTFPHPLTHKKTYQFQLRSVYWIGEELQKIVDHPIDLDSKRGKNLNAFILQMEFHCHELRLERRKLYTLARDVYQEALDNNEINFHLE